MCATKKCRSFSPSSLIATMRMNDLCYGSGLARSLGVGSSLHKCLQYHILCYIYIYQQHQWLHRVPHLFVVQWVIYWLSSELHHVNETYCNNLHKSPDAGALGQSQRPGLRSACCSWMPRVISKSTCQGAHTHHVFA